MNLISKNMKIKTFTFFSALIAITAMTSCSGKKSSPEDEVRDFGKHFVEKISANQLDSVKSAYPDILLADSIVPVQNDTVMVVETGLGQYDVTLKEGVILKVTRSEDGNINVIESRGLFAYPEDRMNIAKKTGMWEENISDAKLAERMKDEDFFNYVNENLSKKIKDIITYNIDPGPEVMGGGGILTVTNQTLSPIEGNEYIVTRIISTVLGDGSLHKITDKFTGKSLQPNSSVKYNFDWGMTGGGIGDFSIKINIPEDQIAERFASFSGNEYQDYLSSKM